jgi:hypothetical protein
VLFLVLGELLTKLLDGPLRKRLVVALLLRRDPLIVEC